MEIDVSKCPYFVEEHEWWDIAGDKKITKNCCDIYLNDELNRFDYDEKCADNQDCYYKQLQQLKAENEELQEKIIKTKEMLQVNIEQTNIYPLKNNLIKILKKLEVENEIL